MGVQVQTATKDGQGNPLSILNRQFISFSYGGKNIEDFDLLVIFVNNRLEKGAYAPFKDTTTQQTQLDGQLFWRSNFEANKIVFNLATDGMTSKQLEEFKSWFKPGVEKELILSEFSNRGILARVSTPPHLSLLPFEKEVEVLVNNKNYYKTKTSLYKGDITLELVMDDPYWYGIKSVITEDINQENLKIIYEDGVPHKSMLGVTCYLANNQYFFGGEGIKEQTGLTLVPPRLFGLYYCGSAETKPIIQFSVQPIYSSTGQVYFYGGLNNNNYYYLKIGEKTLEFTLPELFSSYNRALEIVTNYSSNSSILNLRAELRDSIYNYYTRSYVMSIIDFAKNNREYTSVEGIILPSFKDYFITAMKKFFTGSFSFKINNQTGEVVFSGKVNLYFNPDQAQYQTITENAGNMIKSNYLTIDTRCLPNEKGQIDRQSTLEVKTNTELRNLKINYKNMYL